MTIFNDEKKKISNAMSYLPKLTTQTMAQPSNGSKGLLSGKLAVPVSSAALSGPQTQKVRVITRIRPFLNGEAASGTRLLFAEGRDSVGMINPRCRDEKLTFKLDRCFDETADQKEIFTSEISPLLKNLLYGINTCVFAYGNTGAGKTYTMLGIESNPGIIPRSVKALFDLFEIHTGANVRYCMKMSYFEIYNEKVYDLVEFNGNDLNIREDASRQILIPGLSSLVISSHADFSIHFKKASMNRTTAATKLNSSSSRSHSVLTLTIEACFADGGVQKSKLHLIDLAGSEDNRRTENTGIRMIESGAINKSLFVLGKVVDALNSTADIRVPYRDSKLTRILQDSLGGKSKALMIANISSCEKFITDTANTLNFASKSKQISNNVTINAVIGTQPSTVKTTISTTILLSPMISSKRRKVIGLELSKKCEEVENGLIKNAGSIPVTKLFTPNTKASWKTLNNQIKDFENNFDYSGAIDAVKKALELAPNDKKLLKKLGSLQHTHDSIVSRLVKNISDDTSPCAPAIKSSSSFDALFSSKLHTNDGSLVKKENMENIFCTPTDQIMATPNSNCSDETIKKRKKVEFDLLYIFSNGTKAELMAVKGIGSKRADQIAAYRLTKGEFHAISDLLNVEGFTRKVIENIILLRIAETILTD